MFSYMVFLMLAENPEEAVAANLPDRIPEIRLNIASTTMAAP